MRLKIYVCECFGEWAWSLVDRRDDGPSYLDYGRAPSEPAARAAAARAVLFLCGQ